MAILTTLWHYLTTRVEPPGVRAVPVERAAPRPRRILDMMLDGDTWVAGPHLRPLWSTTSSSDAMPRHEARGY